MTMPVPDSADHIRREVEEDVTAVFSTAFPGEFSVPEPFTDALPIGTGDVTAIPWRWTGVHRAPFHGLAPTGRPVDFSGVTLLRSEGDGLLFHRLVDWLELYRQIDAVVANRRVFEGA
jgi:hypothetical protein